LCAEIAFHLFNQRKLLHLGSSFYKHVFNFYHHTHLLFSLKHIIKRAKQYETKLVSSGDVMGL
jgi:hypothetical protein